ncbi:MAG TPA: tRNA (N6-isopentenyl adenosine(37)-C2)-methylthiotransferase MiaB [Clostridiales bacterium]|nr:tRNA (N6-isopentenyl adenosine(37)-C2)-methylthiotransferase MiaB [Clostridiales bacterium]
MDKFYLIKTYGCQMNIHESEKLAGILEAAGYKPTEDEKVADIIVFNTCCVRENAEDKVYGHIGNLKKLKAAKKNMIIAVGGCMTQQKAASEKLLKTFPFVDIVFGTHNLENFKAMLDEKQSHKHVVDVDETDIVYEGTPKKRTSYPNAWVNISYGCNNFCTYCIVPYVRGRERSRKKEDIIKECDELIKEGYKEITLLGQNVNSYGNDLSDGTNFADLIKEIADIKGKFRLRFMSSHPKDFTDEMIKAIAYSDKICNCVHLPVQAGSTKILKLMNRKYSREYYLERLAALRKIIPGAAVTTDIMVGFPQETEEDFQDTLSLVNEADFSGAFTFVYSRRSGTVADKMDGQIPEDVSTDRIMRLIKAQNEVSRLQSEKYIGKTVEILCEDFDEKKNRYLGRDEYGKMAYFRSDENLIGKFVNVKINSANGISLIGEVVSAE